jgi:hypothetical protein
VRTRFAKLLSLLLAGVISSCGGSGSGVVPPARSFAVPESSTTTTVDGEQLYVGVGTSIYTPPLAGPNVGTIYRYSLTSRALLGTIHLNKTGDFWVSAGDSYIIAPEYSQLEVIGPSGSHVYATPVDPSTTAMTPDRTIFANFPFTQTEGQIVEYRAPFSAPFSTTTFAQIQPSYGLQMLNANGSQAVGILGASISNTYLTVAVPSGQESQLEPSNGAAPYPGSDYNSRAAYDAKHGWYYTFGGFYGGTNQMEIEILDTIHQKWLGYINLLSTTSIQGMSLNQASGDLYVTVGSKVYVYNIASCQCAIPRRVLNSPLPSISVGDSQALRPVIDTEEKHLFLYNTETVGATKVVDVNPFTGAVQATYDSKVPNGFVDVVVAQ